MWRETWCPDLYIAINYKNCLSKLVRRCEADKIQENLNIWQNLARKSRIPEIRALGEKIGRHAQNIINTVRLGFNSARLEAVNNAIKLINRRSYGFSFVENLIDMIYLTFSRTPVQLPKPNLYHLNT